MYGAHGRSEEISSTYFREPHLSRPQTKSVYNSVAIDDIELVDNYESALRYRERKLSSTNYLEKVDHQPRSAKRPQKSWRLLRRRLWSRVLPVFSIIISVVLLFLLSFVPGPFIPNNSDACNPDGDFSLSSAGYTPWRRSGLFSINMKMGSLVFWQAKLIDVLWDVLIGRGGQVCVAFVTYKVFTKGLTRRLQTTAVPHDLFRTITLENYSLYGLMMLIKNYPRVRDRRTLGTAMWITWMVVSASFVLLFPTWLSAMTGYVSDVKPYVTLPDDTRVPLSTVFRPLIYTIHDGARLGPPFTDETYVLASWYGDNGVNTNENRYNCVSPSVNRSDGTIYLNGDFSDVTGCSLLWMVSLYTYQYGFLGLNDTNSTFQLPTGGQTTTPIFLDSPTLNISASLAVSEKLNLAGDNSYSFGAAASWDKFPYGMVWKNPDGKYAFRRSLFYNNITKTVHDEDEMKTVGKCQQTDRVRYQWGFSFVLLHLFIATLMLWGLGMWSFYFSTTINSRLNARTMGIERAAFDLTQSMQECLGAKDHELLSTTELREATRSGMLTYANLPFDTTVPTRRMEFKQKWTLKKWILAEIWWLMALVVFTGFWVAGCIIPYFADSAVLPVFGWIPGLGIFLVLVVGPETHGRWVIAAFFLVPGILLIVLAILSAG